MVNLYGIQLIYRDLYLQNEKYIIPIRIYLQTWNLTNTKRRREKALL